MTQHYDQKGYNITLVVKSSLKYTTGLAQMSSTILIFSHTITVNKMKLLVARSMIAIQNMLWIPIYIYVLKIYITILK